MNVAEYYKPPAVGRGAEPNLPGKSELTMGYGAGGGRPFKYYLRPGQDSTEQVDLSGIEQRSPFTTTDPRATDQDQRKPKPIWDTVSIAVVQRNCDAKHSEE